jgi:hypothetical protein
MSRVIGDAIEEMDRSISRLEVGNDGLALTDLVPTGVGQSILGTAVPYGFVAEAASGVATGRPAGPTPYLGETGIEVQFRDGTTGQILGECRDAQIGRKYAASRFEHRWRGADLGKQLPQLGHELVIREACVRQTGSDQREALRGAARRGSDAVSTRRNGSHAETNVHTRTPGPRVRRADRPAAYGCGGMRSFCPG